MNLRNISVILFLIIGIIFNSFSQTKKSEKGDKDTLFSEATFSGLELRSIGPAFMSGRIADIAINPKDPNQWYVAVGSGGVWKTDNAGVTWTPIFDKQTSYSTGCVTIDPSNPAIIWVGTGENVGGRHVGYGDGIYRSNDGGSDWKNLGLKESHHISKIIVHPDNSNIVWVSAQGPLWSKGGERGIYKTADGGKNWKRVLGDNGWVGATDIIIDPRNPDQLYAATWQRHRNVAAYMGGGPGSGIHSSTDGGETWKKLGSGLPGSNMGKIGLAISPQKPDVIYAVIELDRRTGGFYRSTNRGESWEKRSSTVSGGTGPHYYQELYASPHQFDRIYLMDVVTQVSDDGGKTFTRVKEQDKHGDNHALAFRTEDPEFLLMGTDGGLYESFDLAENWRYITNLPVTQFYKVAVDDAEPFYNIYGGTQDNSTQGGPSRTVWSHGILNSDWFLTVGGDGHQPATEPGNPNIVYSESQQGYMYRVDITTGEQVLIQPQPEAGEQYERFNWDSPILVSPHSPARLYFASHRVWRSENRGDSWTAISGDLTRNQERITLPIMGQAQSWDAAWDISAMSTYNTITALDESPIKEGLIYAGTDDGLIQITEDGGKNWRKIEVGSFPGVPKTAFVNDIKADLFDANTVYITLDDHKFGDLNPYLLKSTNIGKNWVSIKGNIPDRTLIWCVVQDHVESKLLFAGTEFGIYFTIDGGGKWIKLTGGVPTIPFRDLAVQRRENDLVGASFGRGFYILDDYSILRQVSQEQLQSEATLFPPRKAWWYIERDLGVIQGASEFKAPNPPFGAVFTYYLKDDLITKTAIRQKKEKDLIKDGKPVAFPGWDEIESERRQDAPKIWITVKDRDGNVIRRIEAANKKGFHRTSWNLRYPSTSAVSDISDVGRDYGSAMVAPGEYSATLSKQTDSIITDLSKPVTFNVERLYEGALKGTDPNVTAAFWKEITDLNRSISAATRVLNKTLERVNLLQMLLLRTQSAPGKIDIELHRVKQSLLSIDEQIYGNRSKRQIGEKNKPTLMGRLYTSMNSFGSTYGPTSIHKRSIEIATSEFQELRKNLEDIVEIRLPKIEKELRDAGAPWIEGQSIPE